MKNYFYKQNHYDDHKSSSVRLFNVCVYSIDQQSFPSQQPQRPTITSVHRRILATFKLLLLLEFFVFPSHILSLIVCACRFFPLFHSIHTHNTYNKPKLAIYLGRKTRQLLLLWLHRQQTKRRKKTCPIWLAYIWLMIGWCVVFLLSITDLFFCLKILKF